MNPPGAGASGPFELVTVARIVPGGEGLGRLTDGRAAFVPTTVVGDVVRPVRTTTKKGFVRIEEFELTRPGPSRVLSPCGVASSCGGCDWMMMSPCAQREAKIDVLGQALARTGKFKEEELPAIEFTSSERPLGYRSRVRLHAQNGRLGYFSRRSRSLVEFDACLVASPLLRESIDFLKRSFAKHPQEARQVCEVEIRALEGETPLEELQSPLDDTRCSAHLILGPGKERQDVQQLAESLGRCLLVRVGAEKCPAQRHSPLPGGPSVFVVPGGFSQVNQQVNRLLVQRVVEEARSRGARAFVDVYCGSGNFSLPLAAQGLRGFGVEQNPEAIAAARAGARECVAKLNGGEVVFEAGTAKEFLAGLLGSQPRPTCDIVVIDPPRAGAKEILGEVAQLKSRWVFMVSCDPVTLARDLRGLQDLGYTIQTLEIFDMFPQTHHFETLSILEMSPLGETDSSRALS